MNWNFNHQMSLSKSKFWYSNNSLYFSKCVAKRWWQACLCKYHLKEMHNRVLLHSYGWQIITYLIEQKRKEEPRHLIHSTFYQSCIDVLSFLRTWKTFRFYTISGHISIFFWLWLCRQRRNCVEISLITMGPALSLVFDYTFLLAKCLVD